jgi:predicted naringenin-chalcone synthase
MSKLMRGLVLGALLAVVTSASATAHERSAATDQVVQEFRAGERASLDQPVAGNAAVERFRAGERASMDQPVSEQASPPKLADQRRWYYQSTRPQPVAAPGSTAGPDGASETPVGLLAVLAAAAVLSLSVDAMLVRRKARNEARPAL